MLQTVNRSDSVLTGVSKIFYRILQKLVLYQLYHHDAHIKYLC